MYLAIQLYSLRNSEIIQFFLNLLQIIKASPAVLEKVNEKHGELEEKYNVLASLFKPESGNELTETIQAIDKRRDDALNGILDYIEAFMLHYDEALKSQAELLDNSLKPYGSGISRLNYQAETSTITSIVNKWKSNEDLSAALTDLKLNEWVAVLENENTLLNETYLERTKSEAARPELKVRELRLEATNAYRVLLKHLDAHQLLYPDAGFDVVEKQINQLIEQYNKIIKGRTSSNGDDEKE